MATKETATSTSDIKCQISYDDLRLVCGHLFDTRRFLQLNSDNSHCGAAAESLIEAENVINPVIDAAEDANPQLFGEEFDIAATNDLDALVDSQEGSLGRQFDDEYHDALTAIYDARAVANLLTEVDKNQVDINNAGFALERMIDSAAEKAKKMWAYHPGFDNLAGGGKS